MPKKIFYGIILCLLLLIPTTTPVMGNRTSNAIISNYHINDGYTKLSVDPPIWAKGTVWNYDLTDITVDIDQGYGLVFHLSLGTANIACKVVSDSGSSYQVSFKTKITGNVYVETENDGLSIKVQGNLVRMKLNGEILYRKSDLGISSISIHLSGKVALSISKPIRLPGIRTLVTLNLNIGFSNPYTFLSFPLTTNMMWGLPASAISIDGSLKSPWLRTINVVHSGARLMRLIPEQYKEYSDLLAKMLPVVDFSETLALFNISNPINIPELPVVCYSSEVENITVQAGSFDAYNISIMGLANLYYAPEVGKIIKITGNVEYFLPYLKNINMELVKIGKSKELTYN